jgi:RNA polymerase sigma-70 factor (ECF subfamily)
MTRIQGDDLRAFEELYDRHSVKAFGLARFICRSSQPAEEATQDAFLAVWRSRANYDPDRGSARAWLMTMVRHRSIDVMRRSGRHDRHWASQEQLDYIQASGSVAETVESRDEGRQLSAALLELPERQREVIALAYFGGLSHSEIAAHLELPAGTVKGRMRLGLNKMRDEIHRT